MRAGYGPDDHDAYEARILLAREHGMALERRTPSINFLGGSGPGGASTFQASFDVKYFTFF
jgi:hypothetical protein